MMFILIFYFLLKKGMRPLQKNLDGGNVSLISMECLRSSTICIETNLGWVTKFSTNETGPKQSPEFLEID